MEIVNEYIDKFGMIKAIRETSAILVKLAHSLNEFTKDPLDRAWLLVVEKDIAYAQVWLNHLISMYPELALDHHTKDLLEILKAEVKL